MTRTHLTYHETATLRSDVYADLDGEEALRVLAALDIED